jgi:LPXTG-motif cell wall-anchored protein
MTDRYVCRALAATWLAFGVTAVAPVVARVQDVSSLPKGHVTLVGCFLRMADPHDPDDEEYVLANAHLGPATSVPNPNCTATGSEPILKLSEVEKHGLDQVSTGRWMEINGELGKMRDADDLRKFEVRSFREVPVTPPPVALFIPIPAAPKAAVETPQPEQHVETPEPVATTGIETPAESKKLPKTASSLPLIAALGLFALSGGLVLGLFDRRRVLGADRAS